MPKSIGVADFAAKLALLGKRLNWSRAKLAQEVGVDKSLIARWLGGSSRPSDNSFMRLNAAVSQVLSDFTAADWDLPADRFAGRLGLAAGAVPPPAQAATRTTLSGLKHPAKAERGMPYAGLWGGFYQSLSNWGRPLPCVARFAVDELGLRFAWSKGNFGGEGPALATHSYIHCLMEVRPLYDRLFTFTFNAVPDSHASIVDGLISGVGCDGTPAAGPILLFHLHDGTGVTPCFEALSAACARIGERAASEAARTGDPFAVVREIAPVDVLRRLCPRIGVEREDTALDHLLRAPAKRSLGMGRMTLNGLPEHAALREVRSNLRRILGIEPAPAARPAVCLAS
jgi:transcriptional regulator with XRE-family HTH domain